MSKHHKNEQSENETPANEEKVAEEGTDSAYEKGGQRIQKKRGIVDYDIIEIQVAAGNRKAERAHDDIAAHEKGCHTDPQGCIFRGCMSGNHQ